MPPFLPFRGLRYDLDRCDLATVTSPPYDVIDAEGRQQLADRDPHNIVRVDLPVLDEDPVEGVDPYADAAARLAAWEREGVLVREAAPSMYVYRMRFTTENGTMRETLGVFGALELSRPGVGGILPHEHTTPKAKSDRLLLTRATGTNLSAVWGLSAAAGLSTLLRFDAAPDASWKDDDGVEHALWICGDADRCAAISAAVASAPVVIADGHHRYETALTYLDTDGAGLPAAKATLTYVVELVDDQLTVLPIHRLLRGLPAGFDVVAALSTAFEVTEAEAVAPSVDDLVEAGVLALVTRDGIWRCRPRPEVLGDVRDLDTVRLDTALASLPAHELVFQHGVSNVVARVRSGEMDAGVLLRPATVAQIVDIAHGGERMPPKTTFFHPKPRTGVVLRPLER